ncbi:MAG: hypothetical protein IJ343_11515 [Clostridia bacterium]|nr:hypothetical protein [Clostridia bacterium]
MKRHPYGILHSLACLLCILLLCCTEAVMAEDLYEDHYYLRMYATGTCAALTDDVNVAVIFVDLPGAAWSASDREAKKAELASAFSTLVSEAADCETYLAFTPHYHYAQADTQPMLNDSEGWAEAIMAETATLPARDEWEQWEDKPALFLLNVDGRAFAHSEYGHAEAEYAVLFKDFHAGTARHELLHLYGASDYYIHPDVKEAAKRCFPDSIMLSSNAENRTESLTAYLVGWMYDLDSTALTFLEMTADITEDAIDEARTSNQITGISTVVSETYTYTGELTDGVRNGFGVMEWSSGNVYRGDWIWGKRTGVGYYTQPDGASYIGTYEDGSRSGRGTQTWASGNSYTGDFVDNERTGKGAFTWANGSSYSGDFINGARTGKGSYTWANGNMYVGDFVDNVRTGDGAFLWAGGDMYVGSFTGDKRDGKGSYTWANGDTYTGDFVSGARTGKGVYTWSATGDVYIGDFIDSVRTGKGTYRWGKSGNVYTGDFVDNVRTGQGVFIWADGSAYQGSFLNNQLHGQGILTWPDGSIYTGSFANGSRSGYGVYHGADGSVLEGQWQNNRYVGAQ